MSAEHLMGWLRLEEAKVIVLREQLRSQEASVKVLSEQLREIMAQEAATASTSEEYDRGYHHGLLDGYKKAVKEQEAKQ